MLEARGAFAEAEPLLRRVLEATERLVGPEHRVTLTAVNNVAWVLQLLGKLSEAPLRAASSHGRVAENLQGNNRLRIAIMQTISNHFKPFHQGYFVWPRPEAWIFPFQSPFFSVRINAHLVIYGIAKAWTCQSLAKDVCKEQMPRCKACGVDFLFVSQYCWTIFGRTNALFLSRE